MLLPHLPNKINKPTNQHAYQNRYQQQIEQKKKNDKLSKSTIVYCKDKSSFSNVD